MIGISLCSKTSSCTWINFSILCLHEWKFSKDLGVSGIFPDHCTTYPWFVSTTESTPSYPSLFPLWLEDTILVDAGRSPQMMALNEPGRSASSLSSRSRLGGSAEVFWYCWFLFPKPTTHLLNHRSSSSTYSYISLLKYVVTYQHLVKNNPWVPNIAFLRMLVLLFQLREIDFRSCVDSCPKISCSENTGSLVLFKSEITYLDILQRTEQNILGDEIFMDFFWITNRVLLICK